MIRRGDLKVGAKILPVHVENWTGQTIFCCFPENSPYEHREKCGMCPFFNGVPRKIKKIESYHVWLEDVDYDCGVNSFFIDAVVEQFQLVRSYNWRKL